MSQIAATPAKRISRSALYRFVLPDDPEIEAKLLDLRKCLEGLSEKLD
jgi:hypothetical protein